MGGGGLPACKSPYDVPAHTGLRNFCGKCASGPMDKVKFGLFLSLGLTAVAGAAISHHQIYRPRWAIWNTPAGDYSGTLQSHH